MKLLYILGVGLCSYAFTRLYGIPWLEATFWAAVYLVACYAVGAALGIYAAGVCFAIKITRGAIKDIQADNPEFRMNTGGFILLGARCLVFPIFWSALGVKKEPSRDP